MSGVRVTLEFTFDGEDERAAYPVEQGPKGEEAAFENVAGLLRRAVYNIDDCELELAGRGSQMAKESKRVLRLDKAVLLRALRDARYTKT